MPSYTKVVDCITVTDTDVAPPKEWTNVYEDIGGDWRWKEEVVEVLKARGLDGDAKPLYGSGPETGDIIYLMLVVGKGYYFWNYTFDSIYKMMDPWSLERIVRTIDDYQGTIDGLDAREVKLPEETSD